jgi:hypothetical protein
MRHTTTVSNVRCLPNGASQVRARRQTTNGSSADAPHQKLGRTKQPRPLFALRSVTTFDGLAMKLVLCEMEALEFELGCSWTGWLAMQNFALVQTKYPFKHGHVLAHFLVARLRTPATLAPVSRFLDQAPWQEIVKLGRDQAQSRPRIAAWQCCRCVRCPLGRLSKLQG